MISAVQKTNRFSHIAMLADFEQYNNNLSIVEILKIGKVLDRNFAITGDMLDDYVKNFNEGVYGTEIQVNLGHNRDGEAAGWIRSLFRIEDRLLAEVEWTPLGVDKVKSKQYRFTSSELSAVPHHETGEVIDNVLIGVGLTNIPAVKGLAAVSLSEEVKNLINQENMTKEQLSEEKSTKEVIEETESTEEAPESTEEAELAEVPAFIKKKKKKGEEDDDDEEGKKKEKKFKEKKKEKDLKDPEETEEEEEEEDMKKKKMAKKKAPAEKLSESNNMVALSEYQSLQEKNVQLEEKIKLQELSETIKSDFLLSEGSSKGYFAPSDESEVRTFLMGLSQEQTVQLKELLGKVRTVDMFTVGVSKTSQVKLSGDVQEDIVALSDSLLETGKAKDIYEAQKMAKEQLNS